MRLGRDDARRPRILENSTRATAALAAAHQLASLDRLGMGGSSGGSP